MDAHQYSSPTGGVDTSVGIPRKYAWLFLHSHLVC